MADPLSVSASVAGLIGLTGQLLSGCLSLKGFYSDVKNAPKEILSLATQLNVLSDVVQDTSDRLNGLPQGLIVARYEPTIKQCLGVVDGMKAELNGYSIKQGDTKRSRWWTKVKYASQKEVFRSQLSRLEHAKTQVLMVNDNILVTIQNKTKESLTATTTLLQTVFDTTARTELNIDQTHMELRDISRTMNRSSARIEPVINQTHLNLQDMSRTIDQSNSQLLQGMQSLQQTFDHQLLAREIASLLQDEGFRSLGEHRDGTTSSQSFKQSATYTNVPFGSDALACGRKRARKLRVSRTIYKLLFFDVEVTTFKPLDAMNDIQGEHCIAPAITTETHIRLEFPLSQRTTSLHILREALNPYVTRTLTTYNTVSTSSPLCRAVKSLDLCEMRRLFVNGLASPRDRFKYDISGRELTLLDQILQNHMIEHTSAQKGLDMLEYLLQVAPPRSEKSGWVKSLFEPSRGARYRWRAGRVVAKLRLLEQYCPAQFWENIEPQFSFDEMDNDHDPIYRFVQARDGHIFDLNNRFMEDENGTIYFAENNRHILEDASGLGLLLALKQNYPYWPLNCRFGHRLRGWHLITQLLDLCAEFCQGDLIQCYQTRIKILINHGHYTNYLRSKNRTVLVKDLPFALHPMEFAIHSKTFHVLHDALLDAGWTENMIQASLDDVIYAGIPELFGGMRYMSQDECREEFIQELCRGDYLHFLEDRNSDVACTKLALSLGIGEAMEVGDMIAEANASYSQRFSLARIFDVYLPRHFVHGRVALRTSYSASA